MGSRGWAGLIFAATISGLMGCNTTSGPPSAQGSSNDRMDALRLFAGECLLPEPPEGRALIAGIVAAVAPHLISKGIDLVEGAIRQAGEEKQTPPQTATLNSIVEVSATSGLNAVLNIKDTRKIECIQIVEGSIITYKEIYKFVPNESDPLGIRNSVDTATANSLYAKMINNGIYLEQSPNLFLEMRVAMAPDASALAFAPTWLIYNQSAISNRLGIGNTRRDLVISIFLLEPSSTTESEAGTATLWSLEDLQPGAVNARFDQFGPQLAWLPVTLSERPSARIFRIAIVETREANAFLLAVADAIAQSKTALAATIEENVIPAQREAAELATQKTEVEAATNFATSVEAAHVAVFACDQLPDDASVPERLEKATAAYKAQLVANLAAAAAKRNPPFRTLVAIDRFDTTKPESINCPTGNRA
jgi:hypothetical protein